MRSFPENETNTEQGRDQRQVERTRDSQNDFFDAVMPEANMICCYTLYNKYILFLVVVQGFLG